MAPLARAARPRSHEAGVLVVEAPDAIRPWVGDRFARLLRACAEAVLGPGVRVELVAPGAGAPPTGPAPPPQGAVIAAGSAFNPRFTFDQFVIGDANRLAHAAALAVAEMPGLAYNPLFICGPPGLGKTHLLHSIANYVREHGDGLSVRYTTAEAFTNHFVGALHSGAIEAFKAAYRDVDVLLVDDVQFLQSKARTEQEFFHTFNALHGAGAQLVLTSDRLPRDIDALEDRLRERFEAGLVTDVRPPDAATRLTILRKRVQQDELELDDQALEPIAARVETNLRALEGALIRVVAFGSLTGRAGHRRARRRGARRPLPGPQAGAGPHRARDPGADLRGLRRLDRAAALLEPGRAGRLAAPGRHVPRARADRPDAAGDRPRVRRPQPHDRDARVQAHGRAHRRRPRGLRGGPPAHRAPRRHAMSPTRLADSGGSSTGLCMPETLRERRSGELCTPSTPLMTLN